VLPINVDRIILEKVTSPMYIFPANCPTDGIVPDKSCRNPAEKVIVGVCANVIMELPNTILKDKFCMGMLISMSPPFCVVYPDTYRATDVVKEKVSEGSSTELRGMFNVKIFCSLLLFITSVSNLVNQVDVVVLG
jgi:hypothetical protein